MGAPLYIVGIGPGNPDMMTIRACKVLEMVACIAGYSLYVDLLPANLKAGKRILSSGMRQERERCLAAIHSARAGVPTALVCSGDPGIYAMASLALELLAKENLSEDVPLEIVAGVPALCAAAACLGAPLGHDFACISLSDLLTPGEIIEKRLHGAFAADFVCVLYNPRSRGRPDWLDRAITIARKYRPASCPVGLVRNAGREGETTILSDLGHFEPALADMLSLVIIGNSESSCVDGRFLTPRGYARKYG